MAAAVSGRLRPVGHRGCCRPGLLATQVAETEVFERMTDVSDGAVRAQLTSAENAALVNATELTVAKFRGYLVNPYEAMRPHALAPGCVRVGRTVTVAPRPG